MRHHGIIVFLVVVSVLLIACKSSSKAGKEKVQVSVIALDDKPGKPVANKKAKDSASASFTPIQMYYANQLRVKPECIKNEKLYSFIDEWMGTPYYWGGDSKRGIDCSAFVRRLFSEVYEIELPRTSIEQFYKQSVELYHKTEHLVEGDLVFFKTLANNNAVSHVGFYLANGYFVNSSSSRGVSIASLRDDYWSRKYVACGRLKQGFYQVRN
jgi:lipoprotein Spr